MDKTANNNQTADINTDRAQLQALGEYFRKAGNSETTKKQNTPTSLSEETQKGLRELAAREAHI